jgi:hypothetical protein
MKRHAVLLALAVLPLSGCESDSAAYMIETRDHAVTVIREKAFPWSGKYETRVVVARLPHCQRRYELKPVATSQGNLDLFKGQAESSFALKQGRNWYALETVECRFQVLDEEPDGLTRLGTFRKRNDAFVFVPVDAGN